LTVLSFSVETARGVLPSRSQIHRFSVPPRSEANAIELAVGGERGLRVVGRAAGDARCHAPGEREQVQIAKEGKDDLRPDGCTSSGSHVASSV
jgi:hypothetical protein